RSVVKSDRVAGPGGSASHGVAAGRIVDEHAAPAVGDGRISRGISADVIAFQLVACRTSVRDVHAVLRVPGDDVGRPGRRSTYGIADGTAAEGDPSGAVGQGGASAGGRADAVTLEDV